MVDRSLKRLLNGVLLLDKHAGQSSNAVLQQVKRLYQAAKAGHTGSLDPFATGLLPICFGEATKFSGYALNADKSYQATMQLGATSTTGDTEGEIHWHAEQDNIDEQQVQQVLPRFTGHLVQIPPMYSALKVAGKPLYRYARDGVAVERAARPVHISHLGLLRLENRQATIVVTCSKGTYIRTLAEDIGQALGCGAYLTQLRRTQSGHYRLDAAYTLEYLTGLSDREREALILPVDSLLSTFPGLFLDEVSRCGFCCGQPVSIPAGQALGMTRVYSRTQQFLGLGEVREDSWLLPRRLLQSFS